MDGMLLDTERLSFIAWKDGAKAIGYEMEDAFFHSLIGLNWKSIQLRLLESLGADIDVTELTRVAGLRYDELITEGAPIKPGVKECLSELTARRVPQALATSSSERITTKKLGHHGLLKHFKAVVTGDQVTHGKPHPEPYLTAARRLGVDPARCIAFEDSVNGIRSAHGAGMHTVLIPDLSAHDEEAMSRVSLSFDSLLKALPFLKAVFAER